MSTAAASNEEIVEPAGHLDRQAFSNLYESYFQQIYDFAYRTVRNREIAGDVAQETFSRAWLHLRTKRDIKNMRAWLFAVARNAAIDELRSRKRVTTIVDDGEPGESLLARLEASPSSDPEMAFRDQELVELVWSAAAALSPSDYTLLDLHARRGLESDELAENLGLRKGAVYTRLSRLKDSLETAVTSMVMMRRGRRECPVLDQILEYFATTQLTREVNRAIQDHLKTCPRCEESRKGLLSPIQIFAGLAPVSAMPGMSEEIWSQVMHRGPARLPDQISQITRHPIRSWRLSRRGTKLIALVAGLVLVLGATAAMALRPEPVRDPVDVHSTSHQVGVASSNNVVTIAWSPLEGVAGYSVQWSGGSRDLPNRVADLPGRATGTSSEPLEEGEVYFHLRTKGDRDDWTSTVHLGPFIIVAPQPEPGGGEKQEECIAPQDPGQGATPCPLPGDEQAFNALIDQGSSPDARVQDRPPGTPQTVHQSASTGGAQGGGGQSASSKGGSGQAGSPSGAEGQTGGTPGGAGQTGGTTGGEGQTASSEGGAGQPGQPGQAPDSGGSDGGSADAGQGQPGGGQPDH